MKYLTHKFVESTAKSLETVDADDLDEFKFDWITPSIIDRAKDVLHKLKYKNLTQGLYIWFLTFVCLFKV